MMSWEEAYKLAKILARKIKKSGFRPDLVIGIARGGLVPARSVCDFLLQKDLASIKVEHWGIAQTLGKPEIKIPLPIDISGKTVLVVDDVADTGDTYSVVIDYLGSLNPKDIKTAALQYKTCSTFIPDYWGEKQDKWKWIIYPWALYEDMTGFIGKVLISPRTSDEIRKSLKTDFDITISKKNLLEILNDMLQGGMLKRQRKTRKVFWKSAEK